MKLGDIDTILLEGIDARVAVKKVSGKPELERGASAIKKKGDSVHITDGASNDIIVTKVNDEPIDMAQFYNIISLLSSPLGYLQTEGKLPVNSQFKIDVYRLAQIKGRH